MRLIDADALESKGIPFETFGGATFIPLGNVRTTPTIDAVPVVRCQDCKHGEVDDPYHFPDQYYCHEGCGWNEGDFFCSYGERKE